MKLVKICLPALACAAVLGCGGPPAPEPKPMPAPAPAPTPKPVAKTAVPAHAAVGKKVKTANAPNPEYPAAGIKSLVDGRMGPDYHEHPAWMGWWYEDDPFDATIDLGEVVTIDELGVHALTAPEAWIFYPRQIMFELSRDGVMFSLVATVEPTDDELASEWADTTVFKTSNVAREARYVRVRAKRYGELPEYHPGHGGADGYEGEAWLFIDEILVNPKK